MKILCITSRVPWPLEKGDKLRAYHQLRHLGNRHEVILCAINDTEIHPDALEELKKFCSEIHVFPLSKAAVAVNLTKGLFSGLPFQVAYFTNGRARRRIDAVIRKTSPDRIYCQLIRTAEYARHHPNIPRIIDYMDVFSKGIERRISKVGVLKRGAFRSEWKRLLKYEADIFPDFEAHTIISTQDRDLIPVK
ncbi:MAG TPA: hypothetical protein VI731_04560, partial [Bacteroidia bacterium]|nr:hypothetical protein [Bacteroidia bacterium]